MTSENIFIASNIKYLRNLKGLSLKELAKVVDKTDSAVYYWENGSREPNSVDIYKLANFFGVNIDDLLTKDLRFDNVDNICEEISVNEFVSSVNELIDKTINMSDKDKFFLKQSLSYLKDDKKEDK